MSKIIIRKKIKTLPLFFVSKWVEKDYLVPLSIWVNRVKVNFYLDQETFWKPNEPARVQGHVEIIYEPPADVLLEIFKNKRYLPIEEAKKIFSTYVEAYSDFEVLLQYAGGVKNLIRMMTWSVEDFFDQSTSAFQEGAMWALDRGEFEHIFVKFPKQRGKNPLAKADQLVTPKRWQNIQSAASNQDIPDGELLELYKLHAKAAWNEIRIPTIEASIISESLLRKYGLEMLRKNGFSNSKIKKLQNELSFNNLLNIVLPISLKAKEMQKIGSAIEKVDKLRTMRNDLVHGNKSEQEINLEDVRGSVEAAIKLVRFIKLKLAGG